MELKPGYKQTEVGVIPEDWNCLPSGGIVKFFGGNAFSSNAASENGIRWLKIANVGKRRIDWSDASFLPHSYGNQFRSFLLTEGDVVMSLTRPIIDGQLKIARLRSGDDPALLNQRVGKIIVGSETDLGFIYYALQTLRFVASMGDAMAGTDPPNIGSQTLQKIPIPLPPTKAEQEAIAEALGDADALLESLEHLIAKKRQIKQGAMQELLTGKRRLPGFTGDWEERSIDELADCLDSLRIPLNDAHRSKMKGDYPYCGANGVLDYIDDYCVDDSVILMAEDGGYFDEYQTRPIAYRMSGKFWVNNHAHILKSKEGFDQGFLFYSLVHKNILSFLASGTRAKLNKSELLKITVRQPNDEFEQTAIAAILSDMDAEIAALETKLAKARQIKQGMMQELLTGKTRLV
ncbi:MAG: restriction endonuclease subunit S [Verrucomicrobiales bacterium]